MYLLIDWGNTRLKYLILADLSVLTDLSNASLTQTQEFKIVNSLDELTNQLRLSSANKKLTKVLIASVRSRDDNKKLANWVEKLGADVFIAKTTKNACGVECAYQNPGRLGIDRWLAIVGGYSTNHTVGIIDIGSAITLDIVNSEGLHLGGHILPGRKLLKDGLLNTANVKAEEKTATSASFQLGHSTSECVNFGVNQMIASYLNQVISQATEQYKVKQWLLIGGGSRDWSKRLSANHCMSSKDVFLNCPSLIFHGLAKLYLQNLPKIKN